MDALPIELVVEQFDINDKERCGYVIGHILPLFEAFYETIRQPDQGDFNFNFHDFIDDWWSKNKLIVVAYKHTHMTGNQVGGSGGILREAVGVMYASVKGNLFTMDNEFTVNIMYCHPDHQDLYDKMNVFAKQLVPAYRCKRYINPFIQGGLSC